MTKVTFVQPDGDSTSIDSEPGRTVMTVAMHNSIQGVVGECGGELNCATCHVFVGEECRAQFGDPDEFEDEMLDGTATPRRDNSRLSCQLVIAEEPLVVHVPETQY